MSAISYKIALCDAVLELLWRQWNAIGVAGHVGKGDSGSVLDPEALLLFSAAFCRYEPRLYDLMADWVIKYSRLLNPTRLKSMAASAQYKDIPSLSYLAALCTQAGDIRWKRAAENGHHSANGKLESLFRTPEEGAAIFCPEDDALAQGYGFRRSTYVFRNKLRQQLGFTAATLLLNLRGMLGVTARAEVILLLMETPCNIQQLSERSGFVRSAVKAVLDELLLVNLVSPVKKAGGKSVLYTLNNREFYPSLQNDVPVHFPRWSSVYEAIGKIWQLVCLPAMEKVSVETFTGEMRRFFRENVRSSLLNCGIAELENLTEQSIAELPTIIKSIPL